MENTSSRIHGVALLSGGLDSLLATKLIMEQGLTIRCIHTISPFFGKPYSTAHWESIHGLTIETIDISDAFIQLLRQRPKYGFGKVMNPCIDCKMLMMRIGYQRMKALGASFIISGEVVGQRPMSQRKETLHLISKSTKIQKILLRPLCAQHLPPTEPELSGLVDRSKLLSLSGRERKEQLKLARIMGIQEIPSPAGGCKLAERENARRYWPILTRLEKPSVQDFFLANIGRQYWYKKYWLSIGRNEKDNYQLEQAASFGDLLIKIKHFPGPIGLIRYFEWDADIVQDAAALVASYSQQAVRAGYSVEITLQFQKTITFLRVTPSRNNNFTKEQIQLEDIKKSMRKEKQYELMNFA